MHPHHEAGNDDHATADTEHAAHETGDDTDGHGAEDSLGHGGSVGVATIATMRRFWTILTAVTLVLGACGGDQVDDEVTTTALAAFPTAAVRDWLDAVSSGDLGDIAAAVEETSAAILISIENGYSVEELAGLLDGGLPEGVATSYWATFADAFAEFRGLEPSSLVVGDFRALEAESGEYAAVEVVSADATSEVITRRDETGRWQVDMVATFGPALVRRLRTTLDAAGDDPAGAAVRAGYSRVVIPGLTAAMELHADDTLLRSELAAMEVLATPQ